MDKLKESNGQAMADLKKLTKRLNLMLDACDRMLRDIDDPSRYDLGLRAEEVPVTYETRDDNGKVCRKKSTLGLLLAMIGSEGDVKIADPHPPDPRNLLLNTCHELRMAVTTCVQLMERMTDVEELESLKESLMTAFAAVDDAKKQEIISHLSERILGQY